MRKEHELKADIERAKQAASLINHPLFIASLKMLEDAAQKEFKSLNFEDTIKMQRCNIKLELMDEFKGDLINLINNGNSALESLETLKQHQKDINR